MAQYVMGTSAVQLNLMPYDPVGFKRVKFDSEFCSCYVYQEAQSANTLFEIRHNQIPVIVFQYQGLRPWELKQRRETITRLFCDNNAESSVIRLTVMPTEYVDALPEYPLWEIQSPLNEDLFWACPDIRVNVIAGGVRDSIIQLVHEGMAFASFRITGLECDSEETLDAALLLRERIHTALPVRIESMMEHQKIVWFIPRQDITRQKNFKKLY